METMRPLIGGNTETNKLNVGGRAGYVSITLHPVHISLKKGVKKPADITLIKL